MGNPAIDYYEVLNYLRRRHLTIVSIRFRPCAVLFSTHSFHTCNVIKMGIIGEATLKIKEGDSVLGAELTESVAVSSLESDVYISFIIPIQCREPYV